MTGALEWEILVSFWLCDLTLGFWCLVLTLLFGIHSAKSDRSGAPLVFVPRNRIFSLADLGECMVV